MTDEITHSLGYLATPYSRFTGGVGEAFIAAAKLSARLLRAGIDCYSPICHTHPIAIYGDIDPYDHSIWLAFDRLMLDRCDVLIVAHLSGWELSSGIEYEVAHFERARKPIFDLDPDTLKMTKRKTQTEMLADHSTAGLRRNSLDQPIEIDRTPKQSHPLKSERAKPDSEKRGWLCGNQ